MMIYIPLTNLDDFIYSVRELAVW